METTLKSPIPSLCYRADVLLRYHPNGILRAELPSPSPQVKRAGGAADPPAPSVPAPLEVFAGAFPIKE